MGKALIIKGANFSQVAVDTIDIVVGQPTISIDLFGNVTISSPNGEDIYYTTDGSTPTNASTKYTAGFSVQIGTTVKAVCCFGGNYSNVVSQQYDGTLQAPNISITPKGVVTITATNNADIRYTVDGQTDPTASSGTLYEGAFTVENNVEVRAIAYLTSGGTTISSSVSTATAQVVEGMNLNKYLAFGSSLTELDDETQARCVSPYIDAWNGGPEITKNLWKIVWNIGVQKSNNYCVIVSTANKSSCTNYWGNQSSGRTLEGANDSGHNRYYKASFVKGTAGYIEVCHRETTSSEYVRVAKYEYNGGVTDETATWTKTYDINDAE